MKFPLNNRKTCGYSFWQKTTYSANHLGQDYSASVNTPLYAPTDGQVVYTGFGTQGGNWLHFKDINGKTWRFAHLNSFVVRSGSVKEGSKIALTGNTGALTTAAHLHIDIWHKAVNLNSYAQTDLLDPEVYIKSTNTGGNMTAKVYENKGTIWLYFHGIRYAYKSWQEFLDDGWKAGNQTKVDVLPPAFEPETMTKEMNLLKETNKNLQIQTDDMFNQVLSIKKELDELTKNFQELNQNYEKLKNKQCPSLTSQLVDWFKSKFRKE